MRSEILVLEGHIIDSRLLPQVLDLIIAAGADYELLEVEIGKTEADVSRARLRVDAPGDILDRVLAQATDLGARVLHDRDATLEAATADGVLPEGFYATTNLPTHVRIDGAWHEVARPEMDCAILAAEDGLRTVAMSEVRAGDRIVVGYHGVKVDPLERPRGGGELFSFMSSDVSSEKPQGLLVDRIAHRMRQTRIAGRKILWVLGPAVVHTGSAFDLCRLVEAGWVDVVFAGNALATHDAEAAMYGTSLGVKLSEGAVVEHGHEHHLRTINRIRAAGSFKEAVVRRILTSGIMHALVTHDVPFVLGGSVRDDGPMPEVHTDVLEAQRAMRAHIPEVGMAVMVATMLHSIATGNMLPSSVTTVCVDINPATVTKLIDRGSVQSIGMVTDVGLFLRQLADALRA